MGGGGSSEYPVVYIFFAKLVLAGLMPIFFSEEAVCEMQRSHTLGVSERVS